MRRAWLFALAEVVVLAFAATPCSAQAPTSDGSWLTYLPPPECPGPDHIKRRLEEWLGPDYVRKDLKVLAKIGWNGTQWEVVARLFSGDTEGERTVLVSTCTEAADFVALSTALAIDVNFSPPQAPPETSASATPERPSPLPAAPEQGVTEASSAPDSPPQFPPAKQRQKDPWTYPKPFFSVGGVSLSSALPRWSLGPTAQLGIRLNWLSAALGYSYFPPVQGGAGDRMIRAVYQSGSLELCGAWSYAVIALGPCMAVEFGSMGARSVSDNQGGNGFVTALSPTAQVSLVGRRVQVFSALGLWLPLQAPQFELSGGTTVHTPRVGMKIGLGLKFPLTD